MKIRILQKRFQSILVIYTKICTEMDIILERIMYKEWVNQMTNFHSVKLLSNSPSPKNNVVYGCPSTYSDCGLGSNPKLMEGCAPIFKDGVCCPIDWICPLPAKIE